MASTVPVCSRRDWMPPNKEVEVAVVVARKEPMVNCELVAMNFPAAWSYTMMPLFGKDVLLVPPLPIATVPERYDVVEQAMSDRKSVV